MSQAIHLIRPNSERLIPLALFVVVSSVYFMTVTGVTDSNAGSHYAAARALAETGHLDIAGFESFTQQSDYAIGADGALHSDRPPVTAMAAAALYKLGKLGSSPWVQVPSIHDGGNPYVIYAVLAVVLAGAGTVTLFYAILREHFRCAPAAAMLAAVTLAFGTTVWKYSTTMYSHSAAAFFNVLVAYLALKVARQRAMHWPTALALGLAMGASVLSEYPNLLFVIVTLIYLAIALRHNLLDGLREPETRREWLLGLAAAAMGSGLTAIFLMAYNRILWGNFTQISHYWVDPVRWACCYTFRGNFSGSIPAGLQGLLAWGDFNQGLFLLMPVSLLAVFGWREMTRRSARDYAYLLGGFVVTLLLLSKRVDFNPNTDDSRYLVPYLTLWFVPFGVWLDRIALRHRHELPKLPIAVLFYGLLFLSIRNIFMHIAFSWNYDLELANLAPQSTSPENIGRLLQTVFPNVRNLPFLWLLQAVTLVAIRGASSLGRRLPPHVSRQVAIGIGAFGLVSLALFSANMMRQPSPPPRMTPFEATFETAGGETLRLAGYRVVDWGGAPGVDDSLYLHLYWQLDDHVDAGSSLDETRAHLWLIGENGSLLGESTTPLGEASWRARPPSTWQPGRYFQGHAVIPPPQDIRADEVVQVWLALEKPGGAQLATTDGSQHVEIFSTQAFTWRVLR